MEQSLEYRWTPAQTAARDDLVAGLEHPLRRRSMRGLAVELLVLSLLVVVAAWAAHNAGQSTVAGLLIGLLALRCYHAAAEAKARGRTHGEDMWDIRSDGQTAPTDVVVVVDADGLRETDRGVVSVAPWAAMVDYSACPHAVLIRLTNELFAVVPSVPGNPPLAELEARLDAAGVHRLHVEGCDHEGAFTG